MCRRGGGVYVGWLNGERWVILNGFCFLLFLMEMISLSLGLFIQFVMFFFVWRLFWGLCGQGGFVYVVDGE